LGCLSICLAAFLTSCENGSGIPGIDEIELSALVLDNSDYSTEVTTENVNTVKTSLDGDINELQNYLSTDLISNLGFSANSNIRALTTTELQKNLLQKSKNTGRMLKIKVLPHSHTQLLQVKSQMLQKVQPLQFLIFLFQNL